MFKKGDRVKARVSVGMANVANAIGTILSEYPEGGLFAVQFDKFIDGHRGNGSGKRYYCWDVYDRDLEIVHKEVLIGGIIYV